jgi:hypothetical protein
MSRSTGRTTATPFITPTSPQVKVAITTDRKLVIASTGEPTGATGLTQTFVATNVRDFAFTAAPDYHSTSTKVGAVTVRVYYRPGFPASSVKSYAVHAIKAYQPLVGRIRTRRTTWPRPRAATAWSRRADMDPTGAGSLNYLVHHETGHQWFYGIVGSDQAYEPFTDEALTDFLARYVLSDRRRRAARRPGWTSRSTATRPRATTRTSTSRAATSSTTSGGRWDDELLPGAARLRHREPLQARRDKTLLATIDNHTSLNFAPRYHPGSRGCTDSQREGPARRAGPSDRRVRFRAQLGRGPIWFWWKWVWPDCAWRSTGTSSGTACRSGRRRR